jgi:cell fate (sporulation/competence/biofilm development) regulator YlbF (YheA/YmcA/DUF963 family)
MIHMQSRREIPARLQSATIALAESLQTSEPFVQYEHAGQRLKSDAQAKNLLEQLANLQAQVRSEQVKGSLTQEAIDTLRSMQSEAQQNDAIMANAHAQQNAVNYLREVNQEISQLLGFDFAQLTRQSSC